MQFLWRKVREFGVCVLGIVRRTRGGDPKNNPGRRMDYRVANVCSQNKLLLPVFAGVINDFRRLPLVEELKKTFFFKPQNRRSVYLSSPCRLVIMSSRRSFRKRFSRKTVRGDRSHAISPQQTGPPPSVSFADRPSVTKWRFENKRAIYPYKSDNIDSMRFSRDKGVGRRLTTESYFTGQKHFSS